MGTEECKINRYGLVGRQISYSFSRGYFAQKFRNLSLDDCSYENFDLEDIGEFPDLLDKNPNIRGLNVTIPYKQEVIPYLTRLHPTAAKIGAVNTIKIIGNTERIGYNTDAYGFRESLIPYLGPGMQRALVLGTGGASKAVAYVFDELGIPYRQVSRRPGPGQFAYSDIDRHTMEEYSIIVNTTPVGTSPDFDAKPELPYAYITPGHLLYDLIYNPERTAFLKAGKIRGATVCNGLRMLQLQADKAWDIWNSPSAI